MKPERPDAGMPVPTPSLATTNRKGLFIMDTDQPNTSSSAPQQLTPGEMRGLAQRLRARAESVLLRRQPEQHRDLTTAANLIEQLADLAAEVLSSAAVIDRLARLLRITGGA
jgi:hypothetical protein